MNHRDQGQDDLRKRRNEKRPAGAADDFPDQRPKEERGHARQSVSEDGHGILLHVIAQRRPDLVDDVEIFGAAPDIVGPRAPEARGTDDFRHAAGARQQDGDLVGDIDRLFDRVRDEDEGLALIAHQGQQILLEFAAVLLVDRGERLVEKQHLGINRQRARQTDALAHAA
ncbi:MAG: hypothetical protein MI923_03645 [Phycisphaerales bacterium]|nr:hypothetical protein [Phycisphaerales bacterium]